MRLIDGDNLDTALAKECDDCIHSEDDCEQCNFAIARLYVKAAPTIEAEPVNSGWISVEDKLPEDDVDVLVHDKYCGTLIGWYNEKDNIFSTDYISQLDAVTRWAPLPEPPKEE